MDDTFFNSKILGAYFFYKLFYSTNFESIPLEFASLNFFIIKSISRIMPT